MSYLYELNELMTSCSPLFISEQAHQRIVSEYIRTLSGITKPETSSFFFFDDIPTYEEQTKDALKRIQSSFKQGTSTPNLTVDYSSDNLPLLSIAYHRVFGTIFADAVYSFSSKAMERNLLAAEENKSISAHFIHINSGGGEAWYLDRLSERLKNCKKPIYVFIEKYCCSAAFYIGSHGNIISCLTPNDTIGCIGTMISFWDAIPYFEKIGFNFIEEYALQSDLKNKKYNNLRKGKPQQFIEEELNPLAVQFIETVRSNRKSLASLPDDSPILRGETFDGVRSVENGLIDSIVTFEYALSETYDMAKRYSEQQNFKYRISNVINL